MGDRTRNNITTPLSTQNTSQSTTSVATNTSFSATVKSGAIAGPTVATVCLIGVILIIVFLCWQRHKHKKQPLSLPDLQARPHVELWSSIRQQRSSLSSRSEPRSPTSETAVTTGELPAAEVSEGRPESKNSDYHSPVQPKWKIQKPVIHSPLPLDDEDDDKRVSYVLMKEPSRPISISPPSPAETPDIENIFASQRSQKLPPPPALCKSFSMSDYVNVFQDNITVSPLQTHDQERPPTALSLEKENINAVYEIINNIPAVPTPLQKHNAQSLDTNIADTYNIISDVINKPSPISQRNKELHKCEPSLEKSHINTSSNDGDVVYNEYTLSDISKFRGNSSSYVNIEENRKTPPAKVLVCPEGTEHASSNDSTPAQSVSNLSKPPTILQKPKIPPKNFPGIKGNLKQASKDEIPNIKPNQKPEVFTSPKFICSSENASSNNISEEKWDIHGSPLMVKPCNQINKNKADIVNQVKDTGSSSAVQKKADTNFQRNNKNAVIPVST